MLAPIITKDMKLFPTRPLPAGIKNVRSRAQSLDQFNQVQNSGSARGRIVPVKPRSSQSTGNLPAAAAAAAAGAAGTISAATATSVPSFSRSPPKTSLHRKTTLTAIQEGVEMGHSHAHAHRHARHSESQSDGKPASNVPRRNSSKKSSRKTTNNDENVTRNGHCENQAGKGRGGVGGGGGGDPPAEKKEKKGVVKWLTSAFRKSKEKDSDNSSCNSS